MAFNWLKKNKDKSPTKEEPVADTITEDNDGSQTATADTVNIPDEPENQVDALNEDPPPEAKGYFKRLKSRLSKTRHSLAGGFDKVSRSVLDEYEALLVHSCQITGKQHPVSEVSGSFLLVFPIPFGDVFSASHDFADFL